MKQLVRLRILPSRDGGSYAYFITYKDEDGRQKRVSLGHADRRKAKHQQAEKERELRMGITDPQTLKLSDFVTGSLATTGDQIHESTREEYWRTMRDLIRVVGNKDIQRVSLQDGERYRQVCLDEGNRPATVVKKLKEIKCILQTAVKRRQLDENPLAHIQMPKYSAKEVHVFTEAEWTALYERLRISSTNIGTGLWCDGICWCLWPCARGCVGVNYSIARGRTWIWQPRPSPSFPRRTQRRRGRGSSRIVIEGRCH